MTAIDINRLKGNYAEHFVASWLSRVCLVRPVSAGTDIGVDLYCETIIEGTPFLHFWVQVKTINQSNIKEVKNKEIAWYDFETKHLKYWERQPVPVYAFLVPLDDWPPSIPKRIYTVKLTEQIIRNGIPNQSYLRMNTSEWADLEKIDVDLKEFVNKVVPGDTSIILLQKGFVAPIPELQEVSEKRYPIGIGYQYLDKILENIRDASVMGLNNSLKLEQIYPAYKTTRKRFESIALLFLNNSTISGLSMLVESAIVDNEIEKAKNYIYNAIIKIENDPRKSEENKRIQLDKIQKMLNNLQ